MKINVSLTSNQKPQVAVDQLATGPLDQEEAKALARAMLSAAEDLFWAAGMESQSNAVEKVLISLRSKPTAGVFDTLIAKVRSAFS